MTLLKVKVQFRPDVVFFGGDVLIILPVPIRREEYSTLLNGSGTSIQALLLIFTRALQRCPPHAQVNT